MLQIIINNNLPLATWVAWSVWKKNEYLIPKFIGTLTCIIFRDRKAECQSDTVIRSRKLVIKNYYNELFLFEVQILPVKHLELRTVWAHNSTSGIINTQNSYNWKLKTNLKLL